MNYNLQKALVEMAQSVTSVMVAITEFIESKTEKQQQKKKQDGPHS